MFSIPLSISFFPITELIALEPILTQDLLNCLLALFQFVSCVNFIFFFFWILFTLSCVGVFARVNLTFFFVFRFFLGSTVFVLDTRMFPGNYFLLILSYLYTKDVPLGRFTATWTGRRQGDIFSLIFTA